MSENLELRKSSRPRSLLLLLAFPLLLVLVTGVGLVALLGFNCWQDELDNQKTRLYQNYTQVLEDSLLAPMVSEDFALVASIAQAHSYHQDIVALEIRDPLGKALFSYVEEGQSKGLGTRIELDHLGEEMGAISFEVSSEFIHQNSVGFFWTFLISSIGILMMMAVIYYLAVRHLIHSNVAKIHTSMKDYVTGQRKTFTNVTNFKELQVLYDLLNYMSATIESQMVTLNRTLYGVENSNIGIFILDDNSQITYANKKAAEQLGFRRHELTDRKFSDLDSGWAQRKWNEREGKAISFQTAFQRKDLSMISVEVYANHFKLDREELYFCFVEDISLREKARNEMVASEERFFTFMNIAPFFAYIKDQNLELVYLNQQTKDLQTDLEQNNARGFFNHKTAMLLEEADRQILNGSKDRVDLEFDIDWRGERHWFRDIKFPIRQADGSRIIGGLAIDISSQKKYEQELLKAKNLAEAGNRVKGAFLANMSHEMRTPLNGLLGMINLLQSENLSPTGKTYLDIAVLSAQKMHAIVEDLITLADLENHEPVLYSELVDVKEQFITVCDGIKNNLQEKGLELILSLPEESVQLRTIPPRFSQVILGLISNAVKFSEDGQITVKLQRAQDGITFSVTDQGIGIPKDRIEEIFEPLRQLEDPYTKKFAGIGAGLSIVKKIMDTLGGTITVDSEVGLGTTFTVTMPNLQQQGEESIPSPVISPAEEHLDRGTEAPQILIVEDEAVNRLYLKMILGRMGCTVLEAADGYEAILNCEKNSPDLIFMDIGLPELNGVETTARIRQIPRMSDKPVIALTAHTHSDDVKSFLEGGLNQVIKKPFMEGQIRLVLENYLDESRLTAQKK